MDDRENPYAAPRSDPQPSPDAGSTLSSPGVRRTATGLGLVYYGTLLMLLTYVVATAALVLMADARQVTFPMIVGGSGVLVGGLLIFIGQILCVAVPSESGARALILGSVTLQVTGLLVTLATSLAIGADRRGPGKLFGLFGVIAALLFIMFLKRLSHYIGRNDLGNRAGKVLILFLASTGAVILGALLVLAKMEIGRSFVTVGLLVALVTLVLYLILLNAVRRALRGT